MLKFDEYFFQEIRLLMCSSFFFLLFAAVIIAVYGDPIKAEQAASVVESLGDYLTKCGY